MARCSAATPCAWWCSVSVSGASSGSSSNRRSEVVATPRGNGLPLSLWPDSLVCYVLTRGRSFQAFVPCCLSLTLHSSQVCVRPLRIREAGSVVTLPHRHRHRYCPSSLSASTIRRPYRSPVLIAHRDIGQSFSFGFHLACGNLVSGFIDDRR